MTDTELRAWAKQLRTAHTPAEQAGNAYDRCALCSYTRHPCDTYDLADAVLGLLDRIKRLRKVMRIAGEGADDSALL